MLNRKNSICSKTLSLILVIAFMFTLLPAAMLVSADDAYVYTLTSDKSSVKSGENVTLTVTLAGAMADIGSINYEIQYNSADFDVDIPTCLDNDWLTNDLGMFIQKGKAYYSDGFGEISAPKYGSKGISGFEKTDVFTMVFQDLESPVSAENTIYTATNARAGVITFTAKNDITDISKAFTLADGSVGKVATLSDGTKAFDVQKNVTFVQIKSDEKPEPSTGYTYTLTSDKSSVKNGEDVKLTVTLDGAMADIGSINYEIQYNSADFDVDIPTCLDNDWLTNDLGMFIQKGKAYYSDGFGEISAPKYGSKGISGFEKTDVFTMVFQDLESPVSAENTIYTATNARAGVITFTAKNDITDISKAFTLADGSVGKVATLSDGTKAFDVQKDVKFVQLKGGEVPPADTDVEDTIALIDAIGTVEYTDASKAKIDAARAKYDSLSAEKQAKVTNYQTLADAEAKYAELKANAEANAAKIKAVEDAIAAIGTVEYTDDCKTKIDAARKAYDDLDDSLKSSVPNYETLTAAEAKYDELKKAAEDEAAEIERLKKAAAEVDALIGLIGDVTLEKGDSSIKTAEDALNALDPKAVEYVTKKAELEAARAKYNQLLDEKKAADEAAAKKFTDAVDAIGDVVYTDECKSNIEAAEKIYSELTDDQKALVAAKYDELAQKRKDYSKLDEDAKGAEAAAKEIEAVIAALGEPELTDEFKKALEEAEAKFEGASDAVKALVSNKEDLEAKRTKYNELLKADEEAKAIDAVEAAINDIGTVEYTPESKAKIDTARKAYDDLIDALKEKVSNYATLTDAEAKYEELKKAAEGDAAAINEVIELINKISDPVTLADGDAIKAARKAYDALTVADKETKVTNLSKLTAAEEAYKALVTVGPITDKGGNKLLVIDNLPDGMVAKYGSSEAVIIAMPTGDKKVIIPVDDSVTGAVELTFEAGTPKTYAMGNVYALADTAASISMNDVLAILKRASNIVDADADSQYNKIYANALADILSDLNGDGIIDSRDAVLAFQIFAGDLNDEVKGNLKFGF